MVDRKTTWTSVGMAVIGAILVVVSGCSGNSGNMGITGQSMAGNHPPYWICASQTPFPTSTQQSPPEPLPGTTATPGGWSAPNWPPTPQPSPTPFYKYGEFPQGRNVWVKYDSGYVRVTLVIAHEIGSVGGNECKVRAFVVKSFADEHIDLPMADMVFIQDEDNNIYGTTPEVLKHYFGENLDGAQWFGEAPTLGLEPGDERQIGVPICMPTAPKGEVKTGLMVDLFHGTETGSVGHALDAQAGSDSAIYFGEPDIPAYREDLEPTPCYIGGDLLPWPEVESPPIPPPDMPFAIGSLGGRLSGEWPVNPAECVRITRGFGCSDFKTGVSGAGRCPASKPFWHTGVDISCPKGVAVRHVGVGGMVYHWGWSEVGYGNLVVVGAEAYRFYYAHLSKFGGSSTCGPVGCGPGGKVGEVGSTGFSTGNHLHFEIRIQGVPVDPFLYIGGSQGAAPVTPTLQFASLRQNPGLAMVADSLSSEVAVTDTPPPVTPDVGPVSFVVRMEDGAMADGVTISIDDIDGEYVTTCEVSGGMCTVEGLPAGVYSFALGGQLPDGTDVAAHGAQILADMQGGGGEYHHGPMAFYHTPAGSTVGIALLVDADGVAQPYLDADPEAPKPVALVPEPVPEGALQTAEASSPDAGPGGDYSVIVEKSKSPLIGLFAGLVLLVCAGLFYLGTWLRNRRKRQGQNRDDERRGESDVVGGAAQDADEEQANV